LELEREGEALEERIGGEGRPTTVKFWGGTV
jgi:hypothetical protein